MNGLDYSGDRWIERPCCGKPFLIYQKSWSKSTHTSISILMHLINQLYNYTIIIAIISKFASIHLWNVCSSAANMHLYLSFREGGSQCLVFCFQQNVSCSPTSRAINSGLQTPEYYKIIAKSFFASSNSCLDFCNLDFIAELLALELVQTKTTAWILAITLL